MPPKKKFAREQIVDAAFEIAKTEGIGSITIRKIAEKLGSSIAPIYVNFEDVDELVREVIHKIADMSRDMLMRHATGDPFRDIGLASLRFAKEYPALFRDLVMKPNPHMQDYDNEMGILIEQMKRDPQLDGFTGEELRTILLKMRIFQLGLSVMAANGLLPEHTDEAWEIGMLDSAAADVLTAARLRKKGARE
ncbi:hypothetical protein PAE9249_02665 [Paenibacillus sp. CECT 9249]|uniref:TetR/AcrR family transcriptional regulator n=1 Tax=Paenibacillus sp. CECT 9249 TaxID=2845385 RepID=UPI001E375C1B|nr:TetR/AcrR family transcriptional regulator [Paenibacillus sp. CECT 9249]CAH0120152.1 hypothetical protein PAE9249_02665 [Paenibacillus sp. CECT 9249]